MKKNTQKKIVKITKKMAIADIISRHPEAAEILLSRGLHCVGCQASAFENLEEGAMAHGMSDKEIDEIVDQINKELGEKENSSKSITITKKGAAKFLELMKKEGKSQSALRIEIVPGGCAGMNYKFSFVNGEPAPKEERIVAHGLTVFINNKDQKLLEGATIDYVESLDGSGFSVKNPNAKSVCGCGDSSSQLGKKE
ncbi:hypothetical protein CMO92_03155 [Candidatus Woesearchaeota archaeon]|nr:hypothetical protein [Candidatus Woesearchaeota archaeon]